VGSTSVKKPLGRAVMLLSNASPGVARPWGWLHQSGAVFCMRGLARVLQMNGGVPRGPAHRVVHVDKPARPPIIQGFPKAHK